MKLPPSYRQFLEVTNGLSFHISDLYLLHPIDEVEWIDWLDTERAWEETPKYAYTIRDDAPAPWLEIGAYDVYDCHLLNPHRITADGEWEAAMYSESGDIDRASSFWRMMQDNYHLYFIRDFPFRSP